MAIQYAATVVSLTDCYETIGYCAT